MILIEYPFQHWHSRQIFRFSFDFCNERFIVSFLIFLHYCFSIFVQKSERQLIVSVVSVSKYWPKYHSSDIDICSSDYYGECLIVLFSDGICSLRSQCVLNSSKKAALAPKSWKAISLFIIKQCSVLGSRPGRAAYSTVAPRQFYFFYKSEILYIQEIIYFSKKKEIKMITERKKPRAPNLAKKVESSKIFHLGY